MAGTPPKIPYRWTAQDVAGARAAPPLIVTPYGINAAEAWMSTGNPAPDDKRWAKSFLDGDTVELPAAACRIPWKLEQFDVPQQIWEVAPPEVLDSAETIGDLCQKLAELGERYAIYADFSSETPASTTPEGKRHAAGRKREIAKKLLEYWRNTDYRWALLHSGVDLTKVDQEPEASPIEAEGSEGQVKVKAKLTWILARSAGQAPVGAGPNASGGSEKKVTKIWLSKAPSPTCDPGKTPYSTLPGELLQTVCQSFSDRIWRLPETTFNLDNAYWGGTNFDGPKSPWEALDRWGPQGVNTLVRIFNRMRDIDKSLWTHVKYIRNFWPEGIKVVYKDRDAVRDYLDELAHAQLGSHTVGRDKYFYALMHQKDSAPVGYVESPYDENAEPPDAITWREIYNSRDEGLHICIAKAPDDSVPPKLDDIHIDWDSPVSGFDRATERCQYVDDWTGQLHHFCQAVFGMDKPVLPFTDIDALIERATALTATSSRNVAIEFQLFAGRWESAKMALAVNGTPGRDDAMIYYNEAIAKFRELTSGGAEGGGP